MRGIVRLRIVIYLMKEIKSYVVKSYERKKDQDPENLRRKMIEDLEKNPITMVTMTRKGAMKLV